MSVALCASTTSSAARSLLVFRRRSRHTLDFDSQQATFDLPLLEFCELQPEARLSSILVGGEDQCAWVDGISQAALVSTAARCILTQSAYQVSGSGASVEAAAAAARAAGDSVDSDRLIRVVDLAQPDLRRDEAATQRARAASQLVCHNGGGGGELTLLLCASGQCAFVGRWLCDGPAGGPGAPSRTPRRPYVGWLGRYALRSRPFLTPTAMEPELAFLMANLARVRAGAAVLDPCCGSGGLLLCAAALGDGGGDGGSGARHGARAPVRTYGVDSDADAFAGAAANFEQHGLAVPSFAPGDLLAPCGCAALRAAEAYDAILCDPPCRPTGGSNPRPSEYRSISAHAFGPRVGTDGMGAQIDDGDGGGGAAFPADDGGTRQPAGGAAVLRRRQRAADAVVAALLLLASTALVPGGRLACFVPTFGARVEAELPSLLEPHLPPAASLRVVAGRRQCFSPTFARWLVCLERDLGSSGST